MITRLFAGEVEQRLRLYHRHLVRVSSKSMDMKLAASGLEVNITERLKSSDFQLRILHKHTSILRKSFEVFVALLVQIRTHLLDLKIRHVTYFAA